MKTNDELATITKELYDDLINCVAKRYNNKELEVEEVEVILTASASLLVKICKIFNLEFNNVRNLLKEFYDNQ